MDQFNKILAVFLLLVVAVGLSLFIFSRLGILSRILPSSKLVSPTETTQPTKSPTPTQITTPTPPNNKTGILGWISQLGKPKATLTPSLVQNSKLEIPNQKNNQNTVVNPPITKPQEIITNTPAPNLQETTPPNITIVPYGSTSVPTYPASGVETIFIPSVALSALFGLFLKNRTKK